MPPAARLTPLGPADLEAAHALSHAEGWPHRREEWQFLLALGSGFGIRADGRLLGTAVLTPYGDTAATASMVIVAPEARGTGFGRQLMTHLLAAVGPRECRLVATDSGRPLYERLGFVGTDTIQQYQGIVGAVPPAPLGIKVGTAADMVQIAALDRAATGMDRSAMLRQLAATGAVFLLDRGADALQGYATCRAFGRGWLLGPLVALDPRSATRLLRAGLARQSGQFLRVDLTGAGLPLLPMLRAAGLTGVGGGLAMSRPGAMPVPAPDGASVYALTSQALG